MGITVLPDLVVWPAKLLCPAAIEPNPVPFSRGDGRTLGGAGRALSTDVGYWEIGMSNIPLRNAESRRWWNAIRTSLKGKSGLAIIPAWSWDTAPYASGMFESTILTTHSDGSPFSDGGMYSQDAIRITNVDDVPIGATSIRLQLETGFPFLSGVRFSYGHALYETGLATDVSGAIWTVPIFPMVRAAIPAGSNLNFDLPTCLVHLQEDRGMDLQSTSGRATAGAIDMHSIKWVEATDYWSDLAAGLVT